MEERTNIPNSAACEVWEMLLADALDGLLAPRDEALFTAHKANCQACAVLFEQARQGREWLEFLAPEPEVPAGLVDRILAHTGPEYRQSYPVAAGAGAMVLPGLTPAWQRPGFMGFVRRWAEPRLMMTAAMAFFSIALTLNLFGIRLSQIRLSDLRPTAVRSFMERRLTMASVPIIRYYDHLHLVYQMQSRMRELWNENGEVPQPNRNQSQPAGPGESRRKDGGLREHQPAQRSAPVQATADEFGRYVDTAWRVEKETQADAGMAASDVIGGKPVLRQGNARTDTKRNKSMTVQNRAFRRLPNPAVRTASERSRVWTA